MKEELEKRLCELADLFLEHYNPCGMEGNGCVRGGYPCCHGSSYYGKMHADCPHSKPEGCVYPNIRCKVSFCWYAKEKMDKECFEAFKHLEALAKLYGFKNEPPWLEEK
jgi:hypothetical protein